MSEQWKSKIATTYLSSIKILWYSNIYWSWIVQEYLDSINTCEKWTDFWCDSIFGIEVYPRKFQENANFNINCQILLRFWGWRHKIRRIPWYSSQTYFIDFLLHGSWWTRRFFQLIWFIKTFFWVYKCWYQIYESDR